MDLNAWNFINISSSDIYRYILYSSYTTNSAAIVQHAYFSCLRHWNHFSHINRHQNVAKLIACRPRRKRETLSRWWFNVGPPSQTVAQHWIITGQRLFSAGSRWPELIVGLETGSRVVLRAGFVHKSGLNEARGASRGEESITDKISRRYRDINI